MNFKDLNINYKKNKITETLLQDVEYLSNKFDNTKPTKKFKIEISENEDFVLSGKTKDDIICELRNKKYDLNKIKSITEVNDKELNSNIPKSWSKSLTENNIDIKYLATMNNKNSSIVNENNDSKSYYNVLGIYFTVNEKPYALVKLNKKPLKENKNYKVIVPIKENNEYKYEEKILTFSEFKENYLPKKQRFNIFKITEK